MSLKGKRAFFLVALLATLSWNIQASTAAPDENRLESAPNGSWQVIIRISTGEWIQAWGTVPPTPSVGPSIGTQYRNQLDKKTYRWNGSSWLLSDTWDLSVINSQVFTLPCCAAVVNANVISATGITFHITAGASRLRTINILQTGTFLVLIFDTAVIVEDNTGNLDLAGTFNATANDTLTVVSDGVKWYEMARSVN